MKLNLSIAWYGELPPNHPSIYPGNNTWYLTHIHVQCFLQKNDDLHIIIIHYFPCFHHQTLFHAFKGLLARQDEE